MELLNKNLIRYQALQKSGTASSETLERVEINYLRRKQELEGLTTTIRENEIRIEQLRAQIIDLTYGKQSDQSEKTLQIQALVQRLQGEISTWEDQYLIKAPITGRISLSKVWSTKQFVKTDEELFTIVPQEGLGKSFGKAILPIEQSGKIEVGQKVKILLDGYPYQEFGVIRSEIKSIALIQNNGGITLELSLPEVLMTSYEKEIPFQQELQGTANIITKDRRILARLYDKVLSALKNR